MPSRREVVLGGALAIIFGSGSPCGATPNALSRRRTHGCILALEEAHQYLGASTDTRLYVTGDEPMIPRSGDRDFDRALAMTLARISAVLDVLPGFAYYDDGNRPNALATRARRMDKSDGTVLFGQTMLAKLLRRRESPDAAVAAVCAHEFGHIYQFKHYLIDGLRAGQPNVKRVELHADFLAGYFAGVRKLERPNFPAAVFADTQHSFGDEKTGEVGHHGTHEERGAAIVKGFQVAFEQRRALPEAVEIGLRYVMGR